MLTRLRWATRGDNYDAAAAADDDDDGNEYNDDEGGGGDAYYYDGDEDGYVGDDNDDNKFEEIFFLTCIYKITECIQQHTKTMTHLIIYPMNKGFVIIYVFNCKSLHNRRCQLLYVLEGSEENTQSANSPDLLN